MCVNCCTCTYSFPKQYVDSTGYMVIFLFQIEQTVTVSFLFLICFFVLLPSKLCIFWGSSEIKAIFEELQCQQKHGSSYLVKCKKSFRKPRAFLMNPCVTVIARIRILIFRDSFIPFTPVIDSMHFSQFHESVFHTYEILVLWD